MKSLLTLALLATLSGGAEKNPLDQTNWNLTQMQLGGQTVTPDAGLKATATFTNGHMGGKLACNSYGLDLEMSGQNLKRGTLLSTTAGCGDVLNQQANQYLQVLHSLQRYQLRGDTLTLFGKGQDSLTFKAAPANQIGGNKLTQDMTQAGLVGDWQIVSLTAGGVALTPGTKAVLSLLVTDGQLKLTGSAGCNRLSAEGQASAGRLSFGPVMSTRMMCADMSAENALLQILAAPLSVNTAGGQMRWQGAAGEVVLRKAAAPVITKPEGSGALEGKTFLLQTVNGEAPAIRGITIGFAGGQVSGSDGCNRYFGAYSLEGPLLSAPRLGSTLMACLGQPDSPSIVKLLAQRPMYQLRGNQLILSAGGESWLFVQVPGRK